MSSSSNITNSFVGGSISGTVSTVLLQPLDVIKTKIQISQNIKNESVYTHIMRSIYNNEGITGFWKGLSPTLLRCVPGVGLYFTSLHVMNTYIISNNPTSYEVVAVGALSRSVTSVIFNPITIIKTRFESGEYRHKGIIDALNYIYRMEGGLRGFTQGLAPTIVRDAPFSALYYLFYTKIKIYMGVSEIENVSSGKIFLCAIISGGMASIITHPADMVKTYSQIYRSEFSRFLNGVYFIHEKFGPLGYFKGLSMRFMRRTLMTAITWTVYENLNNRLKKIESVKTR